MARSGTFDDETRRGARELFDAGKGCNAIARELGVGAATISAWAKAEGLSFDRSKTELAVRAHTIDLAEARLVLAQQMMAEAMDELSSLDAPYLVYNMGGKDNTYQEHLLDAAPMEVRGRAMTNAGIAFDKATRIVERSNPQLEQAEGLIDAAAAAFEAAATALRERDETPTDAAPA